MVTAASSSTLNTSAAAQRLAILERLKCGPITTLQARELGVMHPAARCMELRRQGFEITTEWTLEYCSGGLQHRVAKYSLNPGE